MEGLKLVDRKISFLSNLIDGSIQKAAKIGDAIQNVKRHVLKLDERLTPLNKYFNPLVSRVAALLEFCTYYLPKREVPTIPWLGIVLPARFKHTDLCMSVLGLFLTCWTIPFSSMTGINIVSSFIGLTVFSVVTEEIFRSAHPGFGLVIVYGEFFQTIGQHMFLSRLDSIVLRISFHSFNNALAHVGIGPLFARFYHIALYSLGGAFMEDENSRGFYAIRVINEFIFAIMILCGIF